MSSELTINEKQDGFNQQQLAALQQMGVHNASQGDLAVFFHQVQRTGLDPFARQIYMIERQGKQTIQTGIDGFRLIARRAAEHSRETFGEPETLWCGSDGIWHDVWLNPKLPPMAAKATVQRGDGIFTGVATYAEYVARKRDGSINSMWSSKPAMMLAKCAEALALRKAFPQDLSGLYTADEMQSDAIAERKPVNVQVVATHEQRMQLAELMKKGGVDSSARARIALKALIGVDSGDIKDVSDDDVLMMLDAPDLIPGRVRDALWNADHPDIEPPHETQGTSEEQQ